MCTNEGYVHIRSEDDHLTANNNKKYKGKLGNRRPCRNSGEPHEGLVMSADLANASLNHGARDCGTTQRVDIKNEPTLKASSHITEERWQDVTRMTWHGSKDALEYLNM